MKKKNLLGITMIMAMLVGLSACGNDNSDSKDVKETSSPMPTRFVSHEAIGLDKINEISGIAVVVTNEAVVTEEPRIETEESAEIETIDEIPTEQNNEGRNISEITTTMYATQAVNVRSGPGTSNPQIGSLTKGQAVTVTGQDINSGWYRIDLNGSEGFVSNKYLSEDAVSSNTTASTSNNSNSNTNTSNNGTNNNNNVNTNTNNSDGNGGSSTTNNTPQNNEQSNPTVVEQPTQVQTQPQTEQVTLPDIEQTKADIIATLRAKGCVTLEEYVISNFGQEFWNESLAEYGDAAYSGGLGWFEGRVASNTYWSDINGIASNYSNNGKYWIVYLRTEGNDLIFRCHR